MPSIPEYAVVVGADHVASGEPAHAGECPVALALKQAFNTDDVDVCRESIRVRDLYFETPETVRDFIADFDGGAEVQPFSFALFRGLSDA